MLAYRTFLESGIKIFFSNNNIKNYSTKLPPTRGHFGLGVVYLSVHEINAWVFNREGEFICNILVLCDKIEIFIFQSEVNNVMSSVHLVSDIWG